MLKSFPILLLCSLIFEAIPLRAEEPLISVNPGVKLGYEFGLQSGFIFGVEISMVQITNRYRSEYWGIVVSADHCHDLSKIHLGFEGGYGFVGVCVGPSFLSYKGTNDVGLTVTPYAGGILIPYCSFTASPTLGLVGEVGSYVKIPLLVKGELQWY